MRFDQYFSPDLAKTRELETTKELKELTAAQMTEFDRALPGTDAAFVIVETNGGLCAKMLVTAARRRVSPDKTVPIVLVRRFYTFKDGEERAFEAKGGNLSLFQGFRLSLDLGQVVPEDLGGDVQCVIDGDKTSLVPVGKAKLFLVTKTLPGPGPKKGDKLVVGEKFDIKYFNGTYQLFDDGRRSRQARPESRGGWHGKRGLFHRPRWDEVRYIGKSWHTEPFGRLTLSSCHGWNSRFEVFCLPAMGKSSRVHRV